MLRAIVFDMDDTLLDWSKHIPDWREVRRTHMRPVYEHLQVLGHSLPALEVVIDVYNEHNQRAWAAAAPPDWIAPRQIDVLRAMCVALELTVETIDLDHLQRIFAWDLLPGVCLFKDTVPVLRTLRAAGLRTGLITNASSPMWMRDRELQALGLIDLLDVRLTAGDVGHLKPHPRPFEVALERLGVASDEAVFVGDRLYDDVVGAQSAGMRAVWVRREPDTPVDSVRPNAIIDSLSDLLKTLDIWYPNWRQLHGT